MNELQNFEKVKQIGKGSFGEVYEIVSKNSNKKYVAKESFSEINGQTIVFFQNELVNILKLSHPSIIKFIGYNIKNFQNESKPTIIMELAPNKSLNYIFYLSQQNQTPPQWEITKKIINIYGIAAGMSYLHENNVIHRNLKPENILLDEYLYPKVTDFGLAKIFPNILTTSKSDIKEALYIAPESYSGEYSYAADVYSFSIIIYQILVDEIPFQGLDKIQLNKKVVEEGFVPTFNEKFPESYKKLILDCGSLDPEKRPTFKDIVQLMQTDKQFILPNVNEIEYNTYIQYQKEYISAFQSTGTSIQFEDYIQNTGMNISKVSITPQNNLAKNSILTLEQYKELNNDCKQLVDDAENDSNIQFFIGKSFIENKNGFPKNTQLGFKYLKRSMKEGNIQSTLYYCKLLKKGQIIPQNLEKAKSILQRNLDKKNPDIYAMYGNVLIKDGDFKQAEKYLMKAINNANGKAMIDYGKMLLNGQGFEPNPQEALKYFQMAQKNGHPKADKYISIILQEQTNEYKPIQIKLKLKLKVILLGKSGVGKTKLLKAMLNLPFIEDEMYTTSNYLSNLVIARDDNTLTDLTIWDTCGQERFSGLFPPQFYRNSDIALICFENNDRDSIIKWIINTKEYCPDCKIFLVETKIDLLTQEQKIQSREKGKEMVTIYDCYMYIMTSAKTREGLNNLLKFASNVSAENFSNKKNDFVLIDSEVPSENKKQCC